MTLNPDNFCRNPLTRNIDNLNRLNRINLLTTGVWSVLRVALEEARHLISMDNHPSERSNMPAALLEEAELATKLVVDRSQEEIGRQRRAMATRGMKCQNTICPPATLHPKIYVVCLASHNAGKSHGEWIDATLEPAVLNDGIRKMLNESPEPGAGEWAIHDYKEMTNLGENPDLGAVALHGYMASTRSELEDYGDAWRAYVEWADQPTAEGFEDAYIGKYPSAEDYAEGVCSDSYDVTEYLQNYIDWKALAHKMECDGEVRFSTLKDGLVVAFHMDNHVDDRLLMEGDRLTWDFPLRWDTLDG